MSTDSLAASAGDVDSRVAACFDSRVATCFDFLRRPRFLLLTFNLRDGIPHYVAGRLPCLVD